MNELGVSTNGWSEVGIQLGSSLQTELDEKLTGITGTLTKSLTAISSVQMTLDTFLGAAGNATDTVVDQQNNKGVSLLGQPSGSEKSVKELTDDLNNLTAGEINGQVLADLMYDLIQAYGREKNVNVA